MRVPYLTRSEDDACTRPTFVNVGGKGADMSLVRSSSPAASHTSKARAWALPRLGVASRLLLAFLGISALAVIGAGVAIYSFREIGDVLDRITGRRGPAALGLSEVSRQGRRIGSAGPGLIAHEPGGGAH